MVARWCKRVRGFVADHAITFGYLAMFAYITVVGGWAYRELSENDSQFCQVAAQRLVDKEDQIVQSDEYLSTPAGMEDTGLNAYIRQVSLPRLEAEVESDRETLPTDCTDEYQNLTT